jgi:magnesium-transporting ATPase (P-type)
MKESHTNTDTSSSPLASSHEKTGGHSNPLVLQDIPEEDDEPPIREPAFAGQKHIAQTCSGAQDLVLEKRPLDCTPEQLAQYFHSSLTAGLDETQVNHRLRQYGRNILKGQEKVTVWAVLWRQISNAMTAILFGALAIAFATKDFAEGSVIAGTSRIFRALI